MKKTTEVDVEVTDEDVIDYISELQDPLSLIRIMKAAGAKLTQRQLDKVREFMQGSGQKLQPHVYRFLRMVEDFAAASKRFVEEVTEEPIEVDIDLSDAQKTAKTTEAPEGHDTHR